MKKLIIWDFDGVVSDTEKLWLKTRQEMLEELYGIKMDFDTVNFYMGGRSDKTKRENLDKAGIITDDYFWEESTRRDVIKIHKGLKPTEGILDIFNNPNFAQCIATGGVREKTTLKIQSVGIENIFPKEKVFTADMVEKGKPEPDLFLLAAKTIGYKPEDCIVIEDSLAGMRAGQKAGMEVIAFLGCEMNNNPENIEKVKSLGVKNIFFSMKDIEKFLIEKYL